MAQEIPVPTTDGLGNQTPPPASPAGALVVMPKQPPYAPSIIEDELLGIAESNPKGFGAGIVPQLVTAIYSQNVSDLQDTRRDLQQLRSENKMLSETLEAQRILNGVLSERLANAGQLKTLRAVLATLAAPILGVGIKILDAHNLTGGILIVVAVLMLAGSWFVGPKKEHP